MSKEELFFAILTLKVLFLGQNHLRNYFCLSTYSHICEVFGYASSSANMLSEDLLSCSFHSKTP